MLRKKRNKDLTREFEAIKLTIGEEMRKENAELGKHRYGGMKE